ncbi:hypothetical protein EDD99_5432 [Streptomyces sp. 846.5]|nr:hypothetical protein EDD99_5432 [Streptomyces sp. 846.5]
MNGSAPNSVAVSPGPAVICQHEQICRVHRTGAVGRGGHGATDKVRRAAPMVGQLRPDRDGAMGGWVAEFERRSRWSGLLEHLESLPWPDPGSVQVLFHDEEDDCPTERPAATSKLTSWTRGQSRPGGLGAHGQVQLQLEPGVFGGARRHGGHPAGPPNAGVRQDAACRDHVALPRQEAQEFQVGRHRDSPVLVGLDPDRVAGHRVRDLGDEPVREDRQVVCGRVVLAVAGSPVALGSPLLVGSVRRVVSAPTDNRAARRCGLWVGGTRPSPAWTGPSVSGFGRPAARHRASLGNCGERSRQAAVCRGVTVAGPPRRCRR